MKKILLTSLVLSLFTIGQLQAQNTLLLNYKYVCSPIPANSWYSGSIPCMPSCSGDQTLIIQVVFQVPAPGGTIGTNPYRMKVELFDASSVIIGSNQIDYSTPSFSPSFFPTSVIPGPLQAKILLQKRNITGWVNVNTYWTNTLTQDACPPVCPPTITITGVYSTPLTEASAWIKTSGTTIIPTGSIVKLDANYPLLNYGFIELNPGFETQLGATFVAQALDGCGPLIPH
jgi:hypothetical protein